MIPVTQFREIVRVSSHEESDRLLFEKGNNYVGGRIMNLPVGNTEVAAQMIQERTGGDFFVIETIKAYPMDYHETTEVSLSVRVSGNDISAWLQQLDMIDAHRCDTM